MGAFIGSGGAARHYGPDDRTAVYRLRDRTGRLLYVGVAFDPEARWLKHQNTRWWDDVAEFKVDWYPNRQEAEQEERRAIREENPLHNRSGRPGGVDLFTRPPGPERVDVRRSKGSYLVMIHLPGGEVISTKLPDGDSAAMERDFQALTLMIRSRFSEWAGWSSLAELTALADKPV